MKRQAALLVALALQLSACGDKAQVFQGWIEANLIFVSADEVGRVDTLAVKEGDMVQQGAPLFTLDADLQLAAVNQANASLVNAKQTFERAQQLARTGSGTQKDYDAAEAALRVAEAQLNTAQTRLARRKVASPFTGTIEQIYFRPGEIAPANRPIVALLPPGNLKVRFFVPQAALPQIKYDDAVAVSCDGCEAGLTARVTFISRSAEYTPPVIYSNEERSKLVFLIEAVPDRPELFRVGQPVSVKLSGAGDGQRS
jgi:HlyD family secretion protein